MRQILYLDNLNFSKDSALQTTGNQKYIKHTIKHTLLTVPGRKKVLLSVSPTSLCAGSPVHVLLKALWKPQGSINIYFLSWSLQNTPVSPLLPFCPFSPLTLPLIPWQCFLSKWIGFYNSQNVPSMFSSLYSLWSSLLVSKSALGSVYLEVWPP